MKLFLPRLRQHFLFSPFPLPTTFLAHRCTGRTLLERSARRHNSTMTEKIPVKLEDEPKEGQLVTHQDKTFRTIREGRAFILVPPEARTELDPKATGPGNEAQKVFYNPIQQFNRDLSVLCIKTFGKDLHARRVVKREGTRDKTQKKKLAKAQVRVELTQVDCSVAAKKQGESRPLKRGREHEDEEDGPTKLRKGADGEKVAPGTDAGLVRKAPDASHEMEVDDEPVANEQAAPQQTNGDAPTAALPNGDSDGKNGDVARKSSDSNGQEWRPQFRILDALSATGLRALRYAQEIPFATSVVANDLDRKAVSSIELNVKHNRLDSKIIAHAGNAIGHMYGVAFPPLDSHGPGFFSSKYDVIDLDPYGTAAPFLDSALHAINDGGLLCVTCTDSGIFASCGYSEKTFSQYGGMPIKGPHSHEGGLRLILHAIATSAARYGQAIEPLLSLSIDFYIRVFVRVRKSPADVKFLAGKTMTAYNCDAGCGAWTTQAFGRHASQQGKGPNVNWKYTIAQAPTASPTCEHCGNKTHVAGPMWAGPLHNADFINKVLEAVDADTVDKNVYGTWQRVHGMLTTALEELSPDHALIPEKGSLKDNKDIIPKTVPEQVDRTPFFVILSALSKVIHCVAPNEAAFKGALRHAGYFVTRSHCKPGSIKTDAPWNVIWEIMREWVKQRSPVKEGSLKPGSAGAKIMESMRKIEKTNGEKASEGGDNSPGVNTGEKGDGKVDEVDKAKKQEENAREPKRMGVRFDEALGKDPPTKRKVTRYQQNPRENWGPMSRAG